MSAPRVINMPRVEQAVIRQGPDTWAVQGGSVVPVVIGDSSAADAASTAIPDGVLAGDLLVACLIGIGTVTPPTGWTLLAAQTVVGLPMQVYTRTADGNEGASATFTNALVVGVTALRHVHGVPAVAAALGNAQVAFPSVGAKTGDALLACVFCSTGTIAYPAGMATAYSTASGLGAGQQAVTATGATGPIRAGSGVAATSAGFLLHLVAGKTDDVVTAVAVTQVRDTDWTDDPTTPVVGQQIVYTADGEVVRR